ncbi:Concanavalin A-like lectin/glucanase, subgroup [Plasmopara halstedii]|uniref:Concanavalin A-like lectin/glucanase, subgroup n=1 Tax=Plasmopara halstedii TaxID=4781 RepID=A0A0P1AQS4_PLAHL|nr:Concanavalin A-like lectin/glucanase, subgroup [Plasmopara halstedii]CEG43703.1 Concanavalin A-like lectin/glucanase, subgroup [Plasmopara halstedii]|eukprot:XP_024580072.1 Concanavalin A-like lectin/glucanase, subgroup [Plasmopara halstedii]
MLTWCFLMMVIVDLGHVHVEAAACPEICYTTELTGFGPGGSAGCTCSGQRQGARVGDGSCSCGQCYSASGNGIIGYAISSDGTCTFGTDCGDCDYSPDGTSNTSTPTSNSSTTTSPSSATPTIESPTLVTPTPDTPSTVAPAVTQEINSSTTIPTITNTNISDSSNSNANQNIGSDSVSQGNGSDSLETWQIALIICCGVLVFTVAVVAVLSCYCKARNRLFENEDDQADVNYYQRPPSRFHEDVMGSNVAATPAVFSGPPSSTRRSVSSSSLTNDFKPMYASSTNSGSSERLMVGLAPVRSQHSSSDLTRSSDSILQERALSGSYSTELGLNTGNRALGRYPSFEHRYHTTREREMLAVDL